MAAVRLHVQKVPETTAVQTNTLPAANANPSTSSTSGGASGGASASNQSRTGTPSASGAGAASSSVRSAALTQTSFGRTFVIGVVGVLGCIVGAAIGF